MSEVPLYLDSTLQDTAPPPSPTVPFSLIRKRPLPRSTIGPQAWAYCRVLGAGVF